MSPTPKTWSIKATSSLIPSDKASPSATRRVEYRPSSTEGARPSDMVIKSGVDEHHVHKEIISPRSDVIAAAMDGKFREGNTGILALDEDDPATVSRMLEFLYTGRYEDTSESTRDGHNTVKGSVDVSRPRCESALITAADSKYEDASPSANSTANRIMISIMVHVKVYALAEMLNIRELKAQAQRRFERLANVFWPATKDIDIIHAVFSSTPTTDVGLRDIMIRLCTAHQTELMADPDFVEAMSEYGDLGVGMFRTFRERKEVQIAGMRTDQRGIEKELESVKKELADMRERTRTERGFLDEELKDLQRRLIGMTSSAYSRADRTDGSTGEAKRLWRTVKDVKRIRGEYTVIGRSCDGE